MYNPYHAHTGQHDALSAMPTLPAHGGSGYRKASGTGVEGNKEGYQGGKATDKTLVSA